MLFGEPAPFRYKGIGKDWRASARQLPVNVSAPVIEPSDRPPRFQGSEPALGPVWASLPESRDHPSDRRHEARHTRALPLKESLWSGATSPVLPGRMRTKRGVQGPSGPVPVTPAGRADTESSAGTPQH